MKKAMLIAFALATATSLVACREERSDTTRMAAGDNPERDVRERPAAADNTERNVRDRQGDTLTAEDQGNSEADRTLTQRIRQAVVDDETLSTNAHNVKIITLNGVVTLRGPVASAQERNRIETMAVQIAGAGKVNNQLEVAAN
jgi:osmotically-inducible protein OsmY